MTDLIYRDECFKIVGASFEVYNGMGCGFLEPIYQECLEIELASQAIPFMAQPQIHLTYRSRKLTQVYKPDFVCYDKIIVEIKAVESLVDKHRAQVINYLNSTGFQLGLLINFGSFPKLEWERLVFTGSRPRYPMNLPANHAN